MEDLKKAIDNGVYQKGELLPSENELSLNYHTTRVTVRQALGELTNMGYITRHKGKGSIVSEPKRALGILSISGVTADVGEKNLKTAILEKPALSSWPEDFPHELTMEEQDAGCIYFARLRFIYEVPVLFEKTFISNINLPDFPSHNLENRSLFKTLKEHYSVEIKEGMQRIWARKASDSISDLLNIKPRAPIVHLKRKLKTSTENLNIYSWLYCNTNDYCLEDYF